MCGLFLLPMIKVIHRVCGLYLLVLFIGYNYVKLLHIITESIKGYFANADFKLLYSGFLSQIKLVTKIK